MAINAYHHGHLRTALAEAAIAEVRAHGGDRLSLRAVARTVGVTVNAVYRHYANRQELLDVVTLHAQPAAHRYLREQVDLAPKLAQSTPAGNAKLLLRAYLSFARDEPHLFRLAFADNPSSAAASPCDVVASYRHEYGRVPVEHWAAIHGFAVLVVAGPLRGFTPAELDRLAERLLNSLPDADSRPTG